MKILCEHCICESLVNKQAHGPTVAHYRLYDAEGVPDIEAFLCEPCVEADRKLGFDWRNIHKEEPCKHSQELNT